VTALVGLAQDQLRDDRPVLATAPLRPGFARADLSRYDDPSWDLGPAVFRDNARRCHVTVHFDSIADPVEARILREYLYARLNIDVPGMRMRIPPSTVRSAFNRARRFLAFVRAELGSLDLTGVDQSLLDRYAKSLKLAGLRPIAASQVLDVVFALHTLRNHLTTARLAFEPWPGRVASIVAGYRFRREENRTPRIPESILAPLLRLSLRYVTHFAPDILTARAELDRLEAHRDALIAVDAPFGRKRRARQRERLAAFFEQRRRDGRRGVPVWTTPHNGAVLCDPSTGELTPPINAHLLHLHIGINAKLAPGQHILLAHGAPDMVAAAVAELGLEVGGMDTPISLDPDSGRPWRPRFDAKAVAVEERMLQAACYIVCAYLTGMRDCEVQAMRSGCVSLTRSDDGLITRHRLRSTAYKNKSSVGEPADWITIAPVVEAIGVLEALSARSSKARGTDTLWPVLSLKTGTKTHVSAEIVRQLNAYRDHLNMLFGTPDEPAIPHGSGGTPWRITTLQFRRTVAWHIANRPFGTIAGMIQYKHASVAAFEGYAGSSRSGFRAEVEAERRLGQLDDLLEYFNDRRGGTLPSGPAGPRVAGALDAAAAELGPSPVMIADRARLRTLLASLARTLHVGVLADCFFDPATALCLKRSTDTRQTGPLTALCEPARCPNACIVERHRPAWARAADDVRAMLREKRLTALQRTALLSDLERFNTVLDGLGSPTAPSAAAAALPPEP